MGQVLVRNVDDALKDQLKQHARENGRSLESEIRERLRASLASPHVASDPRRADQLARFDDDGAVEDVGVTSRPDPNFWRDYARGQQDYGFTAEDVERMESLKLEPVPDPITFG